MVLAISVLALLSGGIAIGSLVLPLPAPSSVSGKQAAASAPTSEQSITDDSPVNLQLVTQPRSPVLSAMGGTVTANACHPGGTVSSGTSEVRVDDTPVIYLATSEPLWRPLPAGSTGADVSALQAELNRLGYSAPTTGRLDYRTLRAAENLAISAGDPAAKSWHSVPNGEFAWIPAPTVTIQRCSVHVGEAVSPGSTMATLPDSLVSAGVEQLPDNPVPGARAVVVDDKELPVDSTGAITDPTALQLLQTLPDYISAMSKGSGSGQSGSSTGSNAASSASSGADGTGSNGPVIDAVFRLVHAVKVTVVPPAAIYDETATGACVWSTSRGAVKVRVVGSQLGQSYVIAPNGRPVGRVSLQPPQKSSCS